MARTNCKHCGKDYPLADLKPNEIRNDRCPDCACPYDFGWPNHPSRKCGCDWCLNQYDLISDPYKPEEDDICAACGHTRRPHNYRHPFVKKEAKTDDQSIKTYKTEYDICGVCGVNRKDHGASCGPRMTEATPCPKCGKARTGVETHLKQLCTCCREATDHDSQKSKMGVPFTGNDILEHLHEKGVITGMCERVIIDIAWDGVVKIYEQKLADESFMAILLGSPVIMAVKETIKVKSEDDG